ncbi:hypothetical protein [Paractinoplanes ferrugineus]|nr:hypothetical protein [Actinoplanes ferrugineus]
MRPSRGDLEHTRDASRLWQRGRRRFAARKRHGASGARLVCFGGAGFTAGLVAAADQDDSVVLVGLDDLYRRGGQ